MKIAIVINTAWNIYNFRGGLIKGLLQEGWEVVAIAPIDDYAPLLEKEYGIRYVPVRMENKGTNPIKDYQLIKRLRKVYMQENPNVILQYTIKPNIYGTLAAHSLGIPVINNVSGLGTTFIRKNIVSKIAKTLYKYSFKKAGKIFFQNDDDRQEFLKNRLVDPKKTALLPGSGVDLQRFQPAPLPQEFSFLFVARLIYDKGIMEFLQAAAILKEKGIKAQFKVLGFIDSAAKLGLKKEEIVEWENKGVIKFLGDTQDIRPFYNEASVIVLPSYREGTPKSLLEALAMGRPIVTTNVPGCKETVEDTINGFLCKVKEANDLAAKMEKIFRLPLQRLTEMGVESRKLAEKKFDEQIVVKKYIHEIKESLK